MLRGPARRRNTYHRHHRGAGARNLPGGVFIAISHIPAGGRDQPGGGSAAATDRAGRRLAAPASRSAAGNASVSQWVSAGSRWWWQQAGRHQRPPSARCCCRHSSRYSASPSARSTRSASPELRPSSGAVTKFSAHAAAHRPAGPPTERRCGRLGGEFVFRAAVAGAGTVAQLQSAC